MTRKTDYSRSIVGRRGARPFLMAIVASAALLTLELTRANFENIWLGHVRLVGISGTATFLGGAIAAYVAWTQVVAATDPFLRVRSWRTDTPDRFVLSDAETYWHVRIHNIGKGIAQVVSIHWIVQEPGSAAEEIHDIEEVSRVLERYAMREEIHFALTNVSPGFALNVDEEYVYFEADMSKLKRLSRFDAVVVFESLVGMRYRRVLPLLPHPGSTRALVGERSTDQT